LGDVHRHIIAFQMSGNARELVCASAALPVNLLAWVNMSDVDPNCLFCKIVAGQIPSTKVAEDEGGTIGHSPLRRAHVEGLSAKILGVVESETMNGMSFRHAGTLGPTSSVSIERPQFTKCSLLALQSDLTG
jgi:hypothetical protein